MSDTSATGGRFALACKKTPLHEQAAIELALNTARDAASRAKKAWETFESLHFFFNSFFKLNRLANLR